MEFKMKDILRDYTYATYQPQVQSSPRELTNCQLEVKLSLQGNIEQVLPDLKNDLKGKDMKVSVDRNNITVTGIPPDDDFNHLKVLEMVKYRNAGAELISHRVQRP